LEEQEAWAARKLDEITDKHALALHLAGWKIVIRDDLPWLEPGENPKWPFNSDRAKVAAPAWCEDIARPKAANKVDYLQVIEGGKQTVTTTTDNKPHRNQEIIDKYFVEGRSSVELAAEYGVSRERICQILRRVNAIAHAKERRRKDYDAKLDEALALLREQKMSQLRAAALVGF